MPVIVMGVVLGTGDQGLNKALRQQLGDDVVGELLYREAVADQAARKWSGHVLILSSRLPGEMPLVEVALAARLAGIRVVLVGPEPAPDEMEDLVWIGGVTDFLTGEQPVRAICEAVRTPMPFPQVIRRVLERGREQERRAAIRRSAWSTLERLLSAVPGMAGLRSSDQAREPEARVAGEDAGRGLRQLGEGKQLTLEGGQRRPGGQATGLSGTNGTQGIAPEDGAAALPVRQGPVVLLWSPFSAGASTLAIELGAALGRRGRTVQLVDPWFTGLARRLGVEQAEACSQAELWPGVFLTVGWGPWGEEPHRKNTVWVVDAGRGPGKTWLDSADVVVLVLDADRTAAAVALQQAKTLHRRPLLVANRWPPGLPEGVVPESVYGQTPDVVVPFVPEVILAAGEPRPASVRSPVLAQCMERLADRVLDSIGKRQAAVSQSRPVGPVVLGVVSLAGPEAARALIRGLVQWFESGARPWRCVAVPSAAELARELEVAGTRDEQALQDSILEACRNGQSLVVLAASKWVPKEMRAMARAATQIWVVVGTDSRAGLVVLDEWLERAGDAGWVDLNRLRFVGTGQGSVPAHVAGAWLGHVGEIHEKVSGWVQQAVSGV